MKKIVRSIVFSGISLYLTSFLIKGFVIEKDLKSFVSATLILAVVYYLVVPISKLILLPLNLLTLGLVSTIAYILIFNYVVSYFGFVSIQAWLFPGANIYGFILPKLGFNYLTTLITSAILYSSLINTAELLV